MLGVESIVINHDGTVSGACGVGLQGINSVICPKADCSCQPDTHISKFR
jgi:hypothetical protein